MKPQIIKKAYTVWHDGMIGSGAELYARPEEVPVTFAMSIAEAKKNATDVYSWEIDGREHEFIDLKCRRAKYADIILFEGNEYPRQLAEKILNQRKEITERRAKLYKYPVDTMFYIQSGFSGDTLILWRTGSRGYTVNIDDAQRYTRDEIDYHIGMNSRNDRIWPAEVLLSAVVRVAHSEKIFKQQEFI